MKPATKKFKRDGLEFTTQDLKDRVPGISTGAAYCRLKNWEKGSIPLENLFRPVQKYSARDKVDKPIRRQRVLPWQKEFLDRIPGPTETEKKYFG